MQAPSITTGIKNAVVNVKKDLTLFLFLFHESLAVKG